LAHWRNKTKRECFVTYCIIAENSSFLKIWKEFARIFVFIGSTTADPLFSAKMCRPCIIEQWPSASISFINYGMWRLKTSLITQTNKIKSSTYTCQSFRSSTYKGACAITWWETNFAAGKQGRKTSKELIIIYIRGTSERTLAKSNRLTHGGHYPSWTASIHFLNAKDFIAHRKLQV
jgi:hypothetical protein